MFVATAIQIRDIDDAVGFVIMCAYRAGIDLERDEKEDLVAEGLCLLYELERSFEPHRPGYAQAGRFSGYAAQFLPRRLGDAWHKRHPNHRRIAGEDGKRKWVYQEAPLSLDQLITEEGERGTHESSLRPQAQWSPVPVAPEPSGGTDR